MIIGDPFRFSVLVESVKEWGGYNGVMIITVDGFMFPDRELLNISLDCMVPELVNNLKRIPVNKAVFNIKDKKCAFAAIYDLVHPEVGDSEDWRYIITPQEIWDKDYYIFAMSDGKDVRILASRLKYINKTSRHRLENITVREAFVSDSELREITAALEDWVQKIK